MKKKIIILAAFVVTFFTACTSTHMITFSNAELSDKEKDMIENNSNYSTASIVGGSAKLVKEERDKAIQEKIEARRNKLKAIDGLSISSYKDKNGKEQFKATAQSEILFKFDSRSFRKAKSPERKKEGGFVWKCKKKKQKCFSGILHFSQRYRSNCRKMPNI